MKKLLIVLLILPLMAAALADTAFDLDALEDSPDVFTLTPHLSADTVYRYSNAPHGGQITPNDRYDEGYLTAYLDYIYKVDQDALLIQLTVCLEIYDSLQADAIAITANGRQYVFPVDCTQSEYDGIYMEDYVILLTDAGLPLIKAIAQQKQDAPIPVQFLYEGEEQLSGQLLLPGQTCAEMYDRFIDLGGKKQPLKQLDALWPCEVRKVK